MPSALDTLSRRRGDITAPVAELSTRNRLHNDHHHADDRQIDQSRQE